MRGRPARAAFVCVRCAVRLSAARRWFGWPAARCARRVGGGEPPGLPAGPCCAARAGAPPRGTRGREGCARSLVGAGDRCRRAGATEDVASWSRVVAATARSLRPRANPPRVVAASGDQATSIRCRPLRACPRWRGGEVVEVARGGPERPGSACRGGARPG